MMAEKIQNVISDHPFDGNFVRFSFAKHKTTESTMGWNDVTYLGLEQDLSSTIMSQSSNDNRNNKTKMKTIRTSTNSWIFNTLVYSCLVITAVGFVTPASTTNANIGGLLLLKASLPAGPNSNVDPVDDSVEWAVDTDQGHSNLLDEALRFNSSAASEILAQMNAMRSRGVEQDRIDAFVDDLVTVVESPLPWWSQIRTFTRFSKRARRASLQRVLLLSSPTSEEKESIGDDIDAAQRRKRRSLVVLLRALANVQDDNEEEGDAVIERVDRKKRVPAIVQLEKAARREAKSNVDVDDIATRLPPGLETPTYEVIKRTKKTGYEIRCYQPFSICSVSMNKPRPDEKSLTDAKISNPQLAGASAFGALAGYLFGKNEESMAMKMTTPVISSGEGDNRQMAFVLPSDFWMVSGLQTAPTPLVGSGVTLIRDEGGERAAVIFGGFAGKKDVDTRTKKLLRDLANDKEWKAGPDSNVTLAQYNDPFTPPWKRRNEVFIKVVPRK